MKKILPTFLVLSLVACAKNESAPTADPSVPPSQAAAPAPAPVETAAAATAVTAAPNAAPTTEPTAAATAKTTAVASASPATAKAGKDAGAPVSAAKAVSSRIQGKNFAIDVIAPGCKAESECTMTMKLVTSNEFHVNKEYPYKFLAAAAPNVTFLGKGEATTFSKASGDFREEGEKSATMTVRFKPTSAGDAKLGGTYKLSVCSADQCQIEQQPVSLVVPVL